MSALFSNYLYYWGALELWRRECGAGGKKRELLANVFFGGVRQILYLQCF